ncbi:MAG: 23S rRNA (guanosine(2251)-2'-O)-methyltransferase RlmB, partial [Mesorhizobium sp.]
MSNDNKSKTPKDTHYAKLRRAHRDEKSGGAPAFRPRQPVPAGENPADGLVRLYGLHTVRAALDNPRRKIKKMLVTRNAAERLAIADLGALPFKAELVEPRDIDKVTGSDA